MRDLDVHCPTCTCSASATEVVDMTAPYFALVLLVERAAAEVAAEDRAAGRGRRRSTAA